jgi:hypothetical protein
MKKLFVTLAAVLVSVSAFAQGTINFNNRVTPNIDAPVWAPNGTGTTGAGSIGATAQLFLVTGSGASAVYTPIGQSTTFRAATAANPLLNAYINPIQSMIVNGSAPGSTINVALRTWTGASFDAAKLGAGAWGESNVIPVTLGGEVVPGQPAATPGQLTGLTAFTMTAVPEPSTIALGILGAAALLYRRRK